MKRLMFMIIYEIVDQKDTLNDNYVDDSVG